MYVEHHILDEAAKQLRDSVGNGIPFDPPGWPDEDRKALRNVLEEVSWADLMTAVRAAGERLLEPDGEG